MAQYQTWEQEYKNPQLVAKSSEPQLEFKKFVKWLRKDQKVNLEGLRVLDLGSGMGKHSLFLAERGCHVTGIEISDTALRVARDRVEHSNLKIDFQKGDIGQLWPFENKSFNLSLDIISSNSLSETERKVYISELYRTLKPGGYVFVRALCKDGDKNAENLLKKFPGKELDTYVMPGTNIIERVFTKADIEGLYKYFEIKHLERKFSYTMFQGKSYKRHFWLVYLKKASK